MKRLSITLSEEAIKIYESWKPHERSMKVSAAILQYGKSTNAVLEELDRRVKALEEKYKD